MTDNVELTVASSPVELTVGDDSITVDVTSAPITVDVVSGVVGGGGGSSTGGKFTHHIELGTILQANQPFGNLYGGPAIFGLHMFCLCVGSTGDAIGRTVKFTNFQCGFQGFLAATSGGAPLSTFSAGDGVLSDPPEFYTFTGTEAYSAAGAVTMYDVVLTSTIPDGLYGQSVIAYGWGRAMMIDKLAGSITTPVDPIGDYAAPSSVTFITGAAAVINKLGPTGSEFVDDPDALLPITDWTYEPLGIPVLGGAPGTQAWEYVTGGNSADGPIRWEVE